MVSQGTVSRDETECRTEKESKKQISSDEQEESCSIHNTVFCESEKIEPKPGKDNSTLIQSSASLKPAIVVDHSTSSPEQTSEQVCTIEDDVASKFELNDEISKQKIEDTALPICVISPQHISIPPNSFDGSPTIDESNHVKESLDSNAVRSDSALNENLVSNSKVSQNNIIPTPQTPSSSDTIKPKHTSPMSSLVAKAISASPKIALIHSSKYVDLLHRVTQSLHGDRDILLSSLLQCCGFLDLNSDQSCISFLKVFPPKLATFQHIQSYFHSYDYLKILQYEEEEDHRPEKKVHFAPPIYPASILESYGLTDDCPLPATSSLRHDLWKYCQYTAGSSLFASHILASPNNTHNQKQNEFDIAIHWGGGRHHAQQSKANGFCYVNDVVLAIQHLIGKSDHQKVLYLDVDIHHGDAVQSTFYETDKVLTCSFHRYTKAFFPFPLGSIEEKGKGGGLGYNVNIPLPKNCTDVDFYESFQDTVQELVSAYKPNFIVMCIGADGLKGDPLVKGMGDDGWNLTPMGIAKSVKLVAGLCAQMKIKLLLLGGGGYKDTSTALTYLLCTAGACEGVRPGLLDALPRDIPNHEFFCRYGPSFELIPNNEYDEVDVKRTDEYQQLLIEGKRSVHLASYYIRGKLMDQEQDRKLRDYNPIIEEEDIEHQFWTGTNSKRKKKRKSRNRSRQRNDNDAF